MKRKSTILAFIAFSVLGAVSSQGGITLNNGIAYTQNFNSLANTGTSSTLPADWFLSEVGGNTTYSAGTGSSSTGDTYSFGSASSTERALGGLQSGSVIPTFGAQFTRSIVSAFPTIDLTITYTGEQWRLGALSRLDRLDFQYSTDATSLTTGTWTDFNALDFIAPITTGSTGARDGNLAANRTTLTATITGVTVVNLADFWIRWTDFNPSGADDGLAIDDFSITAVPEPSAALLGGLGLLVLLRRRR